MKTGRKSKRRAIPSENENALSIVARKSLLPPSRISQDKWLEIEKEEYENRIINSIREEIFEKAMDVLHKSYLTNKACSFVVECAHLAWLQLFNWTHLQRDPGESATTVKERWISGKEPAPVTKDNWTSGNVEVRKKKSFSPRQDFCNEPCEQQDFSYILPQNMAPSSREKSAEKSQLSATGKILSLSNEEESTSKAFVQNASDVSGVEEKHQRTIGVGKEELASGNQVGESSDGSEALSIFTRTISMPKQELPIRKQSNEKKQRGSRGNETIERKFSGAWNFEGLKPPKKLSSERLPTSRGSKESTNVYRNWLEELFRDSCRKFSLFGQLIRKLVSNDPKS